jgi:hypothetical protein
MGTAEDAVGVGLCGPVAQANGGDQGCFLGVGEFPPARSQIETATSPSPDGDTTHRVRIQTGSVAICPKRLISLCRKAECW